MNIRFKVAYHESAIKDYNEAFYWYELNETRLGLRFLKQMREKISIIQSAPETYGEKSKRGFREVSLPDFPYSIVYKIQPRQKVVFISSIHHHKQHPKKKFRK